MKFAKSNEYFENKIRRIKCAIVGTKACLQEATERGWNREIEGHSSYLYSLEKELEKAESEFEKFKRK